MANQETNIENWAETTLTSEMGPTDLTATVATTTGMPASPCYLVIEPDSPTQREVILFNDTFTATTFVTSVIGNRYLSGSAAGSGLTHPVSSVVRCAPLAQHFTDMNDRMDVVTDHGSAGGLGDDDHTQYLTVARHDADDHSSLLETVAFGSPPGELTLTTGTYRWYAPEDLDIQRVTAAVGVAPTGAAVHVDVHRNGTTIFTTQTLQPRIAAAGFFDASGTPDGTSTMTKDTDYLTIDIDQIGSTLPGEDLTVIVEYLRT